MQRFWRWWNSLFVPRAPYPRQIGPAMPVKLVWRRVQGEVAAAYATPIDMGDWEFQDTPLGFGDVLTSQGPDVRDYHVHLAQLRKQMDYQIVRLAEARLRRSQDYIHGGANGDTRR